MGLNGLFMLLMLCEINGEAPRFQEKNLLT